MKTQKCSHPEFYTMGNNKVYCNRCHKYLGFFSPYRKPYGFHKKTKDTIKEEYLNEKLVHPNRFEKPESGGQN